MEVVTYQTVMDVITNQLSSGNLVDVLKYAAGVAVGLVFLWWGARKSTSIIKRAFMGGKLKL